MVFLFLNNLCALGFIYPTRYLFTGHLCPFYFIWSPFLNTPLVFYLYPLQFTFSSLLFLSTEYASCGCLHHFIDFHIQSYSIKFRHIVYKYWQIKYLIEARILTPQLITLIFAILQLILSYNQNL